MTKLLPLSMAFSLAMALVCASPAQASASPLAAHLASNQATSLAGSTASTSALVPYQYHLVFSDADRRLVTVNASVTLKGGTLMMASWGYASQLPQGWATFVENLVVSNQGKRVPVELLPGGKWKVNAPDGTVLQLRYQVRLQHDQHEWDSAGGVDARPALQADSATWITKALMIFSDDDDAKAQVSFDLPQGWRVATPWHEVAGKANTFAPADLYQAYDNAIVVGRFEPLTIVNGAMKVVLVMDPQLLASRGLFEQVLSQHLTEYRHVFGELPDTRYLVAARKDVADDGEAFGSSFVQVFKQTDLDARRMVWPRLLAHEMFHYWNASRLKLTDVSAQEWFTEGVTEYMASRAAVRGGQIAERDWYQMLGTNMGRFFSARHMQPGDKPSLQEAGSKKMQNWRLIYGGGATLGLLLDIELRTATQNRRSIDDVFRLREQRFGQTGKACNSQDLLNLFNEVGGRDFTPFFKDYVQENKKFPPLAEILAKAGWYLTHVADEFYIAPARHADAAAMAVQKGMLQRMALGH
ncbi:MAG: hypothetical protein RL748_849 [Pseudomonadota bacterium]